MRAEAESLDLEQCTFKPIINQKSAEITADLRPVHQRVWEVGRRQQEIMLQKQKLAESRNPKPFISKKSRILAQKRSRGFSANDTVEKRLLQESILKEQKMKQKRKDMEKKREEECTFAPRISKETEFIVADSDHFKGRNADFLTRQKAFASKRDREISSIKEDLSKEYTFQPKVSDFPDAGDSFGKSYEVREKDVVKRLTKSGANIKKKRSMLEMNHMASIPFKPEINPRSHKLAITARQKRPASSGSFGGLGIKMKRDQLKHKYEVEEFQECTFKPQLLKSQKKFKVQSIYHEKDPQAIMKSIERTKKRQAVKSMELEMESREKEYADCTFQPELISSSPHTLNSIYRRPVVVRGLGKHLERQYSGRKQREVKKQATASTHGSYTFMESTKFSPRSVPQRFVPTVRYDSSYTMPRPFKLSSDPRAKTRKQYAKALEDEKKYGECSFTPVINLSSPSHGRTDGVDVFEEIFEASEGDDWHMEYQNLDRDLFRALL
ncbi:hypothetical protein ADUPG1_012685 [Aduncisulcus paluster]|uniref:Uncharacterized protein n=1 Tax=Aduncisulcus paluster TaxID=2918883 RepID=A0ABQ5K259_9EUKA|nr:hypothetical protein ADUPG1_012685 [Aduncisulcus paluster]